MSLRWVVWGICLLLLGGTPGCGTGAPSDQDIENAIRRHYARPFSTIVDSDHMFEAIQVGEVQLIKRESSRDGLYPVRVLVKGTSTSTVALGGRPPQPYQVEKNFNLRYDHPSKGEPGWTVVNKPWE